VYEDIYCAVSLQSSALPAQQQQSSVEMHGSIWDVMLLQKACVAASMHAGFKQAS
jgi:hypothetical protein